MKDKLIIVNPEHEVVYSDLLNLVAKHADNVSSMELLAIAGNMVGKIIALQDQSKMDSKMAMDIVIKNIEVGNKQIIDYLKNQKVAGHV